jgi:hypothetical protein
MLEIYGYLFVRATEALEARQVDFQRAIAANPNAVAPEMDSMESFASPIQVVQTLAGKVALTSTARQAHRALITIRLRGRLADILSEIKQLQVRMVEELQDRKFLFVPPEFVPYWDQKDAFGLGNKFKKAHDDIRAAGNCLALQQPTACIFHLMRAMEVVVRKLSKRLKVTITPNTTWRQMTGGMDDKIKAMPNKTNRQKRKKNDWESARANLHHVGSVWRNKTMHPADSYTQSQAHDVLNATRVFMVDLCDL